MEGGFRWAPSHRQAQIASRAMSSLTLFRVCSQNDVAALLKPISEKIQEIQTFREKNRGSDMFNHLSAVSESIPALGWIAVVSPLSILPHTPALRGAGLG